MSYPRGLSEPEQRAWARLASSVTPLPGKTVPGKKAPLVKEVAQSPAAPAPKPAPKPKPVATRPLKRANSPAPARRAMASSQLDGSWNRKLKSGQITPDYTLDLHDHNLDRAYDRIMSGLDQARMMGARVVLVVAGRERRVDPADRASKRGAIRAKLLDWLAVSRHADSIAAVRRAHIRHGGEGALYLVLKRSG
ncbi:Smr/MutS family protein [Erythrobacter sp. SCSIO 43205]|uniref:Smr/MutS family protein n=1 Tax=Erythrobacter sp. SCSIO 43205 TaxID=2779361 RepID=UPI001CA9EA6B|nr:Smr/MutS family protein [Erythrobacter sp. SCSIO 43205]UAB78167.1 Smr/MutS family protein [Erythrobacter sp. SCSIO 43205]